MSSRIKSVVRSVFRRMSGRPDSSSNLQILETDVPEDLTLGWQAPVVAERQEAAFEEVLQAMRRGKVREDFAALAAAVKATALKDPLIIEVGSGSGWNHSVLEFLLKQNFRYIGMDYSQSMVALGRRAHPADLFVIGDAAALPFASDCCDVLILGTVLMHVLGYREAVQESRRVARNCCIFHTIPVVEKRKTTLIRKNAYGVPVVEITFSEREFIDLLSKNGFRVRETFQSVPHPYLEKLYGEAVHTRTYLCEC